MLTLETIQRIRELSAQGHSASTIKSKLNLDVSVRQVQRYGVSHPVRTSPTRTEADRYNGPLRDIVTRLMVEQGRNPKICDLCRMPQLKPCDIHHTKYEGAKVEDLRFVCRRCNLAPDNKGLV